MPVPSPRNKILPVRGNIATLQSNVGSLSEGEICYALDENRIYIVESGALVPTDADATASLFDAGTEASPGLAVTGDPNTGIYSPGADIVGVSTAGSERLRIDSTGYVGIGKTNPRTNLDVAGNIYMNGGTQLQIATTANTAGLQLIGQDSAESIIGTMSAQPLALRTAAQERLRIDSSGNVGIGTTSPGYKLDVGGSAQGIPTINCFGPAADNNWAGGIRFESNDGTTVASTIKASTAGLLFDYGGTERLRIDSAGKVGIGTSSPGARFDLQTGGTGDLMRFGADATTYADFSYASNTFTLAANNSKSLAFETSAAERLRIDSAGNVGIGTTSPGEKLEVNGTIKATDINFTGLATYADDSAAGTGGLVAGDVYKTSTGELRIKL